jgi:hypothetical protein
VRGAAVFSGYPALLVDLERGVRIRVLADGTRTEAPLSAPSHWCQLTLKAGLTVCLERLPPARPVEAVVLERAAMASRIILERTRGRTSTPRRNDSELIEVLLDRAASQRDRLRAGQLLGLDPAGRARVVAPYDGPLGVRQDGPLGGTDDFAVVDGKHPRAGIGPAVPLLEMPPTVPMARAAARFTADGSPANPGPTVVYADELGGLILLASAADSHPSPVPDMVTVDNAAAAAPWVLTTLHALAITASLRAAAIELMVHHSTLQVRVAHIERLLGWSLRDVKGQTRLQVALMLRRLHRNSASSSERST